MRAPYYASVKYFAHADARWHKLDEEEWSVMRPPPAKRPGCDRVRKGADLCSTHGCILLDRCARKGGAHRHPEP